MKRGGVHGNTMRVAAAFSVGAFVLTAAPAHAGDPLAASKTCRKTIAGEMGKLGKLINVLIDKCHKTEAKLGASRANCNDVTTAEFDPLAKYPGFKQKAHDKIALKCLPGDPALGNYASGDAFGVLLPVVEANATGLAKSILGSSTVAADNKADQKCVVTLGKWHSKLYYEVLKDSAKADLLAAKTATTVGTALGRIAESSIDAGDGTTPLAVAGIPTGCTGNTLTDGCTNTTTCLDQTRTAAQTLTRKLYHGGNVCDPLLGTRTVTVTVHTPQNLAGVKVDLDYPQSETGLVGTEQAELVADRVTVPHAPPSLFEVVNDRESDMSIVVGATTAFLQDGDQFQVTFDACAHKEPNMCNRAQQILGCTITGNICNGGSRNGNICTINAASGGPTDNVCSAGSRRGLQCNTPTTGASAECPGGGAGGTNSPCFQAYCPGASGPNFCVPETLEANPDVCTYPGPLDAYPEGPILNASPAGCCPGDNACVTQASATICSVTDPSDANGNHVSGVTCDVAISGF